MPHDKGKVHLWENKSKEAEWKINKMISPDGIKAFMKTHRGREKGRGRGKAEAKALKIVKEAIR